MIEKIDFLKEKYELQKPDPKPLVSFGRTVAILVVGLATIAAVFSYRVSNTSDLRGGNTPFSFFSAIRSFVRPSDYKLEGEAEDRVNFLLTGIGGEGHQGPQLTDTILFVSYRPSTKKIGFMSLPRDMTVPIPGHGYQKVNHANAYGEMKKTGSGPALANQVLSEVLKQPIPYYLRVDFRGFAELINEVGGIDIYVDKSFTDSAYPILGKEMAMCGSSVSDSSEADIVFSPHYGCRYEVLSFREGWVHMDGDTALKYVRSRHGNNGEGSDFARSRRQQKVLMAVKDKTFSMSTFLNPVRINNILETVKKNIATNLTANDMVRLARSLKDVKVENVSEHVIDSSPSSPLYSTSLNGAYVLLPKNDDWTQLQKMAQYIFTQPNESLVQKNLSLPPIPSPLPIVALPPKPKFTRIEIQNGTNITGLAFRVSQQLMNEGYSVTKVGNATTRDYAHTVIFDLTNGRKTDELKSLRDYFQADVTTSASNWIANGDVVPKEIAVTADEIKQKATEDNIDFLIIIGEKSTNLTRN